MPLIAIYKPRWVKSLVRLSEQDRAHVFRAVDRFAENPDLPGLQFKQINNVRGNDVRTVRASLDLRIFMLRLGDRYVCIEAGHHDELIERAVNFDLALDPRSHLIKDLNLNGNGPLTETPDVHDVGTTTLVEGWNAAGLMEMGMTPEAADIVLAAREWSDLNDAGLPPEIINMAIDAHEQLPHEWRQARLNPEERRQERLLAAVADFGLLSGFTPFLTAEHAREVLRRPIEDWMVFLHPVQLSTVTARFRGPARVRGGPGTGKTVLALHRAAELGRRYPPDERGARVLFTTFIRSLVMIQGGLYQRIPGVDPSAVDFSTIASVARSIASDAGAAVDVDERGVARAFEDAVRQHDPSLATDYIQEEVLRVIKGRQLDSLEMYLAAPRPGRITPLDASQRRAIWEIYETWELLKSMRGVVAYEDVLSSALAALHRDRTPRYSAVIVDEAQDLTLLQARLVAALSDPIGSNQSEDSLFIAGDANQRIYSGGYRLKEAGIDVLGRSEVLRFNYRNTQEILTLARSIADGLLPASLEDADSGDGELSGQPVRHGLKPLLIDCESREEEFRRLMGVLTPLTQQGQIAYADVAIGVRTNREADEVAAWLKLNGFGVQKLERYSGAYSPEIKVGTLDRLKGLEFKVVCLPLLSERGARENSEFIQGYLARLCVAVTRARDWVVLSYSGDLPPYIGVALDHLTLV